MVASTLSFGDTSSEMKAMQAELNALKAEVAAMKSAKAGVSQEAAANEGTIEKLSKKVNELKSNTAGDNLKWGVDLRTAVDSLNYKMADGSTKSNNSLMSNRLLLNMAYAPDSNNIFKGQLSYNKAFGADFGANGGSGAPRGFGFDTFDWVTNEALTGNGLKVKEAYWLYLGDTIGEANIPWTASVGRRPSTDGMLSNLREGNEDYKSPLAHMINVEFDGASFSANVENIIGVPGAAAKLCLGQGTTNATPMFGGSANYSDDQNALDPIQLAGVILTPYDNGQIVSKIQLYRAWDLPGYTPAQIGALFTAGTPPVGMSQFGSIDGYTWSTLVNGIGDEGILSETKLFASLAMSKTNPDAGQQMLGSQKSETGTSYWLGAQVPLFGGKLGAEYNHGSKYWRAFTYGEDTLAGSKLAARGDAYEAYYIYPLTKALTAEARYTKINYDYTGSNNFFGADGQPIKVDLIKTGAVGPIAQQLTVDEADDFRVSVRYKF